MAFSPCTDLASERFRADLDIEGVSLEKTRHGNIEIERLTIGSDEGARSIGKPRGTYITLTFPALATATGEDLDLLGEVFLAVMSEMLMKKAKKRDSSSLALLCVGLGNRSLSADTVGIRIAEGIRATAHIKVDDPSLFSRLGCASLSVLIPGVLGQSGMEAADRVKALIPLASPDAVIVFDALAARSYARIGCTVQITDSGIEPGSGIGNRRRAITEEAMGVPVIAVGVPTVCDTATLLRDALAVLPDACLPDEFEKLFPEEKRSFVSPSDGDAVTEKIAAILAESLNRRYGVFY